MASQWEAARQEFRSAQREVDNRLVELRKVQQKLHNATRASATTSSTDTELRSKAFFESQFASADSLACSVTANLQKMQESLVKLSSSVTGGGGMTRQPGEAAQINRFRDILDACDAEFRSVNTGIKGTRDYISLMNIAEVSPLGQGSNDDSDDRQLLRERGALDASINILDETIEQARGTNTMLRTQRERFGGISAKAMQIGQRLPGVSYLLTRIHRAKLKQSIVLASVFGICLLLSLLYMVN